MFSEIPSEIGAGITLRDLRGNSFAIISGVHSGIPQEVSSGITIFKEFFSLGFPKESYLDSSRDFFVDFDRSSFWDSSRNFFRDPLSYFFSEVSPRIP